MDDGLITNRELAQFSFYGGLLGMCCSVISMTVLAFLTRGARRSGDRAPLRKWWVVCVLVLVYSLGLAYDSWKSIQVFSSKGDPTVRSADRQFFFYGVFSGIMNRYEIHFT